MNSISHLYVAAHQSEMRNQAALERLASASNGHKPSRIGSAAKSVWSLLSGPAERPNLPTLSNYPYRG